MSRIRTIKPEFWVSEQTIACSPNARLLFIGMWNFADDSGVHPTSYVRLKAQIFPADNCTTEEIKNWVNELINNGLIREYAIDDKSYWVITGWKNHQRIDKPTYRYPLPQSELKKIKDNSTITRRGVDDSSLSTLRSLDEPSPTEWKGMEGIGKEVNICEVETSPVLNSETNLSADIQTIFEHWRSVMNHPRAKLDQKRQRKIAQALKLGFSVAELKQAIDGCSMTPHNMGKNEGNQLYNYIDLIFRNAEHIERFINNAGGSHAMTPHFSADDLMAGVI
ncbi:hypothetical protein TUM19329_01700 [Legionella antarctica]|uniref:Uncharacterized protein n=1 Tax=Legionella antarctica TaxID=2708020 RepID=A0A6F8T045_9GAMM|nr:hypothetical protein [Legionella antarctica]BCA93809.1 hypothetical protein TUM19329_01700 [Legionella antarctica]